MSLPLLLKSDQHPPFLKPSLLSSSFFNLLLKKYRQILITSASHPDYGHLCEVTVSFQSALAIFHPPHNLHLHLLATNRILPPRRYSPSSYFSTPKGTHELLSINTLANIQSRYFCHNYFFYLFLFFSHPDTATASFILVSLNPFQGENQKREKERRKEEKKEKNRQIVVIRQEKEKKRERENSIPSSSRLLLLLFSQSSLKTPRPAKPFLVLQLDIPRLAAKSSRTADILTIPVVLQYNRHSPPPRRFNFSGSS